MLDVEPICLGLFLILLVSQCPHSLTAARLLGEDTFGLSCYVSIELLGWRVEELRSPLLRHYVQVFDQGLPKEHELLRH